MIEASEISGTQIWKKYSIKNTLEDNQDLCNGGTDVQIRQEQGHFSLHSLIISLRGRIRPQPYSISLLIGCP